MTLDYFLGQYNEAAISIEDLAAAASSVTDEPRLSGWAQNFLETYDKFQEALEAVGYEFG